MDIMERKFGIAVCSIEGTVTYLEIDVETGIFEKVFNFKDANERIRCLGGKKGLLVTGGDDEVIRVYDPDNKKRVMEITETESSAIKILFSSKYFLSLHENGSIYFIHNKEGSIYHKANVFKSGCLDGQLHHSGKILLLLSKTGRVAIWDTTTITCLYHFKIKGEPLSVKFFTDEILLIALRKRILLYSLKEKAIMNELSVDEEDCINEFDIWNSEDGGRVVIGTEKGRIRVFSAFEDNLDREMTFLEFKAFESRVKKISIKENFLIAISTEGFIAVWNIMDFKEALYSRRTVILEKVLPLSEMKIDTRLVLLSVISHTHTNKLKD